MKIEKTIKNGDGSKPSIIVRTMPDFFSPSVILNKEDRYSVYSTNTHSITVDGQELSNATVLSFRFDKDAQDIRDALDRFTAYLRTDNSTWQTTQLKCESNTSVDPIQSMDFIHRDQSDLYAKIISRYDSITKNLLGLMCFDEVETIKKNPKIKNKDKEYIIMTAAKAVSERIFKKTKKPSNLTLFMMITTLF